MTVFGVWCSKIQTSLVEIHYVLKFCIGGDQFLCVGVHVCVCMCVCVCVCACAHMCGKAAEAAVMPCVCGYACVSMCVSVAWVCAKLPSVLANHYTIFFDSQNHLCTK